LDVKKEKKIRPRKGNCNAVQHGGYMTLSRRKLDGRSKLAKAVKHLKEQLVTDLGGDPSMAQLLLIDRVCFKSMKLCFWELAIANGETEIHERYISLANSFRQDLQLLGLERKAKVYVDLKEYLNRKQEDKK
jgi:hypothetical protein